MIKFKKTFNDFCIFEASVATNGLQGGDAGHGCRTIIELGLTDNEEIEVIKGPGGNKLLRIELKGDAELMTITKALAFIARSLEPFADENAEISND